MERRVSYVLVGGFSLVLIAGLTAFVLWAHERGNTKPTASYAIYFDEAVNGLTQGSNVRYLGVEVGKVKDISLETSGTLPRVRVVADIDASIPILHGTVATLKPSGITGVSFIDLRTDSADTVPITEKSGNLPIIRSESSGFDRLFSGATDSLQRLDALLSPENIAHINHAFASLDHMSGRIDALMASHDAALNRLMGSDVDELGAVLRAAHKTLDNISALTKSLSDNPSQLIFPPHSSGVKIAP